MSGVFWVLWFQFTGLWSTYPYVGSLLFGPAAPGFTMLLGLPGAQISLLLIILSTTFYNHSRLLSFCYRFVCGGKLEIPKLSRLLSSYFISWNNRTKQTNKFQKCSLRNSVQLNNSTADLFCADGSAPLLTAKAKELLKAKEKVTWILKRKQRTSQMQKFSKERSVLKYTVF